MVARWCHVSCQAAMWMLSAGVAWLLHILKLAVYFCCTDYTAPSNINGLIKVINTYAVQSIVDSGMLALIIPEGYMYICIYWLIYSTCWPACIMVDVLRDVINRCLFYNDVVYTDVKAMFIMRFPATVSNRKQSWVGDLDFSFSRCPKQFECNSVCIFPQVNHFLPSQL